MTRPTISRSRTCSGSSRRTNARRPLSMECLEDRRVLATVTLNTDTGSPGELRTAIATAAPGETIDFNLGIGSETISLALGQLVIDKALLIDGNNTAGSGTNVTIDGGGASRVVNVDDGSATQVDVTMRFLNIRNGNNLADPISTVGGGIRNTENLRIETSTISGSTAEFGGGVGNSGGVVTLISSTVEQNSAVYRGGGIYNNSGGTFTVRQTSIILNNAANDSPFSAVGAGGSNFGTGSLMSIVDSLVTGNTASHDDTTYAASGLGGGLANDSYALLEIQNSNITVNTADYGGGAWTDDGATTNVRQNSTVDANTAGERGGGLFGTDGAVVLVQNSSVSGNATTTTGTGDGGAIFAGSSVQLTLEGATVSDNYAYDRGGGIYASSFGVLPGTSVSIENNSVISGNRSLDIGGGINIGQSVHLSIEDSAVSGNSTATDGGGIRGSSFSTTYESTITIVRSAISGNTADDDGGGIEGRSGVRMYIYDSFINDNIAPNGGSRGGGIYVRGEGTSPIGHYLTIGGTMISGNSAGDDGAGIHVGRQTVFVMDDSQVIGNTANGSGSSRGGGIRMSFADAYPTSASITRSTISGNSSSSSGGGMSLSQSVVATVKDSTFAENSAGSAGGGIVNYSRSSLTFQRGTLSGNYAVSTGGGIDTTTADLIMQQSTVSGNRNLANGAGVYLNIAYDLVGNYTLSIEGSTIAFNSTTAYGGGIYAGFYADSTLRGSIVSGNMAAPGPDLYDFQGKLVPYYSLIGTNEGSMLLEANGDAHGNIIGGPIGGVVNPLLGPLQANGGPTQTHALSVGSPAIDVGDPAVLPGTTTDQRGFERVVDGDAIPGARVDMGAYEFGAVSNGDFDGNGRWDCADIDALVQTIAAGTNHPTYDLTGDGLVDLDDITDVASGWLRIAGEINLGAGKSYLVGDANLDGDVDGQDFIVWNSNKFTSVAAWCQGDFNADGTIDGQDFIAWNLNKFMSADARGGSPAATADGLTGPRRGGRNDQLLEESEETKPDFGEAQPRFGKLTASDRARPAPLTLIIATKHLLADVQRRPRSYQVGLRSFQSGDRGITREASDTRGVQAGSDGGKLRPAATRCRTPVLVGRGLNFCAARRDVSGQRLTSIELCAGSPGDSSRGGWSCDTRLPGVSPR